MNDKRGRHIDYLRISLTDRCNLRCRYCMPEEGTELFAHEEILTLEELVRICRLMAGLGIRHIKLTGGEPLVRKNVVWLVKELRRIPGIEDITMTTNGILLNELAEPLKAAGISSVNISLDTLDRKRFAQITRRDAFDAVLSGIQAAEDAGLARKINCAVMDDFSEDEVAEFARFSIAHRVPVRFIEMMPIGQGCGYTARNNDRLLELLKMQYSDVTKAEKTMGNGPAVYYEFAEGKGCAGFISAVHHKFCSQCNRIRLTSDGYMKLCLAKEDGISLRTRMRQGIEDSELARMIRETIEEKPEGHSFGNQKIQGTMNRIGG